MQQVLKLRECESAFKPLPFNAKCPKMARHTSEILQKFCCKIFKVCLTILGHYAL